MPVNKEVITEIIQRMKKREITYHADTEADYENIKTGNPLD